MKTAFVTGACGDIGRDLCARLVGAGYNVAATDIDTQGLVSLESKLGSSQLAIIECDVTNRDSVEQAVERVEMHYGRIDILVNNAGGVTASSLLTTDEAQWSQDIELNLTGAWRCINRIQRPMIKGGGGVIVNIASVNGLGVFGHPGYSVAKAGLIHLTKFAAMELGKYGIRSLAICPGTVRTQAWDERIEKEPEILEEAKKWYPSRSLCNPSDVSRMILMLISEDALQMNGSVVTLDGGLTAGSDRIVSLFTGEEI